MISAVPDKDERLLKYAIHFYGRSGLTPRVLTNHVSHDIVLISLYDILRARISQVYKSDAREEASGVKN